MVPRPHLDDVLKRLPELKIDLKSSNEICVLVDSKAFYFGSHGLLVLDTFAQPRSLRDALNELKERVVGSQDWVDLTSTIFRMYEAGILRDEGASQPELSPQAVGFGSALIHNEMLNDRERTECYLNAIREVVRPGDVVVDIGTGTGILAIAAARAGAKHVYAIEATSIGEIAQAHFEANGLADRITLIPGWSTRISLPEPADVMISEIIGNEPLHERVLEVTVDACERLLKQDGRLVPNRLKVFALPVHIPSSELTRRTVTVESVRNWQAWYEVDLGALADAAGRTPHQFAVNPHEAKRWRTLSDPVVLADLDLKTNRYTMLDLTHTATAKDSGILNAIVVYFELYLGPTTRLSTDPAVVIPSSAWRSPVWVFLDGPSLEIGDRFDIRYRYRADGIHSGISVSHSCSRLLKEV